MKHLPSIKTPADLKKLPVSALPGLAAEIREAIIGQVSKSGGHLAPNLGVVELTIAMHYVFDFGHDRLLFDVGHQCYPLLLCPSPCRAASPMYLFMLS